MTMRSDDRPMARTGMDEKPVGRPVVDDAPKSEAAPREAASAPEEKLERRLTVEEQRKADERKQFKEEQEKLDQIRADSKAMEGEVDSGSLKFWRLRAVDPNAETFMYSNRRSDMIVVAPTERVARRLAMMQTDVREWEDEEQVVIEEFKPEGPMVLVEDFGA
jgi:hypothetical protein